MGYVDLYLAQLVDPFRIGLLIALALTAANTSATLNRWIPIALGIVFVAVIIPMTTARVEGQSAAEPIVAGLFSNATILAVIVALQFAWARLRPNA